ncbi:MAG: cystathionine gamma-synthase [Candidatus Eiseniibacteriota bacterium]
MSSDSKGGFSTRAIHAGNAPDPRTGAVAVPVYQTSTYAQEGLGRHKGYEYARSQNPTREALEANLASLENGKHGLAFASGLAATSTLLQLFSAGDHVVASNNMYGGTFRLFDQVYSRLGLTFTYVNTADLSAIEAACQPETKLLFVETPTNPLLTITDLAGVAAIAKRRNLVTAVDNTFATPYLQRPLELGIDLALHSTTKYLNGHSDMVGGILVTRSDDLGARLRFLQNAAGAVPGPWDCWLALRGTKTLALRMERHERNAGELARWLAGRKEVQKLFYPGLPDHPGHELAKRQMSGFGGIISLEVGDLEAGRRFCEALRLFTLAESLGGVESLVTHPASMTHASVPKAQREETGFTDGLIRLSVGCEDVEDLKADLERGLTAIRQHQTV